MSAQSNTLADLLQEACKLVKAEPWFMRHGYEAYAQDTGDLNNTLLIKIGQTGPGCFIVFFIDGFEPESTSSKNPIGTVTLGAGVTENPKVYRSKPSWKAAFTVAENLSVYLNHQNVFEHTLHSPKIEFRPEAGLITYKVSFKIQYVLKGLTQ